MAITYLVFVEYLVHNSNLRYTMCQEANHLRTKKTGHVKHCYQFVIPVY